MTVNHALQFEKSPILRKEASLVDVFDEKLENLIIEMHHTMQLYEGVGLAAPQLNIPKRIIIFNFEPLVMINPEIIETEGTQTLREGCLSFPQLFFNIKRAKNIKVKWQDIHGQYHTGEFHDLEATAIQHEVDHLNGKLFVDYVSNLAVLLAKKKLKSKGPKR